MFDASPSSWPGLSRPSMSLIRFIILDVDARDKRGHDESNIARIGIILVDEQTARPPELPPLEEKFSVLIEYLDTVVAAIRDEQTSFGIHCEIVRHIKFTWTPSLLAPFLDELSVLVELHDSIVAFGTAVAIGDEYVAIGRDQDIRWLA